MHNPASEEAIAREPTRDDLRLVHADWLQSQPGGGGLGRLARSHQAQQGKVADPRKGFATMYFDSCVFDTDTLEYLVNKAGIDRVMLGSDAPFPIGDPEPLKVFANAKLTAAQKELIFSTTAQKVFRVRSDCWTRSAR